MRTSILERCVAGVGLAIVAMLSIVAGACGDTKSPGEQSSTSVLPADPRAAAPRSSLVAESDAVAVSVGATVSVSSAGVTSSGMTGSSSTGM